MTEGEAIERLQGIFNKVFLDPVNVSRELSADQVEEWDSLLHITLVAAVEAEFDVRFRVGEVESTKNVGEFVDLILKCQQRKVA